MYHAVSAVTKRKEGRCIPKDSPKKDAKGLNVVTGQWSCDQAYNDFVKIISADEHYADLKLSSCERKGCAEKWIEADHAAAAVCTKGSSLIAEDDPEYYVRI